MKSKKGLERLHELGKHFNITDSKCDGQGEFSGKVEIWAQFHFKKEILGVWKYLIITLIFCIVLAFVVLFGSCFGDNNLSEIAKQVVVAVLNAFTKYFSG